MTAGGVAASNVRHPWRSIGPWLAALLVASIAAALLLDSALTASSDMTGDPESEQARALLEERLPAAARSRDVVVVRSARLDVDEPAFRRGVRELRTALQAIPGVAEVRDYYSARDPSLVSRDRHAAILSFAVNEGAEDAIEGVLDAVARADGRGGFEVSATGPRTLEHDIRNLAQRDLKEGELRLGLPAALVVLIAVFGALAAALLMLAFAFVSVVVAVGLAALLGQASQLDVFAVNMITVMGLALGIDYTLFVVSR